MNGKNVNQTTQLCPNCKKEISQEDTFCKHCGTPIAALNTVEENIQLETLKLESSNTPPYTTEQIPSNPNKLKKQVKTIGIVLGGIVAIAIIILIISALICDHQWSEATCTTPETCTLCEKTKGEALGHSWLEATCTAKKTCSRCGETEGDMLEHTPGEWTSYSDYINAKNISEQQCTVCEKIIDTKSTDITKLYTGKVFLLSPSEFIDRLDNKLDSLADNTLSAFEGSTSDTYGCLIYNGTTKVGTLVLSGEDTIINPERKDNGSFSVLLGTVNDTDNVVRVFVALIETCDPTLDLESAKEVATNALKNGSHTKNGVTYVYTENGNNSAYLGVSLLK